MSRRKKQTQDEFVTKEDLEYIAELFSKNFRKEFKLIIKDLGILGKHDILPRLEALLNFMVEIKADLKIMKRTLFFIAKNKLTYDELEELSMIGKSVEPKPREKKLKN